MESNCEDGGKRKSAGCEDVVPAKKMHIPERHWTQQLVVAMQDPELRVQEDDQVVIIKDKYPKAKFHYLVLPRADLANLRCLDSSHVPLLQHMLTVGQKLAQSHPQHKFRLGFHAIPSLSRLHMHVISQDFVSEWMKIKKHWNSFNTEYFRDAKDVLAELEDRGEVVQMDLARGKWLLGRAPFCYRCSYKVDKMPALKKHLLTAEHQNRACSETNTN